VPLEQLVQLAWPEVGVYVPVPHVKHAATDTDPVAGLYVPPLQLVHAA